MIEAKEIQSFTGNEKYQLYRRDGQVIGCSCPGRTYAKRTGNGKVPCKHMFEAMQRPSCPTCGMENKSGNICWRCLGL
jgi:hypothetical protein